MCGIMRRRRTVDDEAHSPGVLLEIVNTGLNPDCLMLLHAAMRRVVLDELQQCLKQLPTQFLVERSSK